MRRVVCIALAVAFRCRVAACAWRSDGLGGLTGNGAGGLSDPTTPPGVVRASLFDVAAGGLRVILQSKMLCCTGAWSPDGKWLALAKFNGVALLSGDGRNPWLLPLLRAPPGNTTSAGPVVWVGA